MSIYKKYFDEISPNTSLDTQTENIRSKARRIKRRRRNVWAAGITAAAFMMCTVTAAATDRNILEMAASWLGIGTEKAETAMAQIRTVEMYNEFNGLEVRPQTVYSDGSVNIFFIDLIRTDGGIFDRTEFNVTMTDGTPAIDPETGLQQTDRHRTRFGHISATSHYDIMENGENIGESAFQIVPSSIYVMDDDDPSDNMITVAVYAEKEKGLLESGEATLNLLLGNITTEKHSLRKGAGDSLWIESEIVDSMPGTWNGNLYFTPRECEKITLTPGKASIFKTYPQNVDENGIMPMYDTPFTVDEIVLTEMTVSLKIHGQRPDEMRFFNPYRASEIFFSDGSSIVLNPDYRTPSILKGGEHLPALNSSDEPWECSLSIMLPETIDLDDVTAIRMGSEVFDVK
ncbi:MAG: hypothetical protein K2K57_14620 [Oscillospiraceae bacterium]|nr:hypothetical protein [Oscillospiraceae bacterium]